MPSDRRKATEAERNRARREREADPESVRRKEREKKARLRAKKAGGRRWQRPPKPEPQSLAHVWNAYLKATGAGVIPPPNTSQYRVTLGRHEALFDPGNQEDTKAGRLSRMADLISATGDFPVSERWQRTKSTLGGSWGWKVVPQHGHQHEPDEPPFEGAANRGKFNAFVASNGWLAEEWTYVQRIAFEIVRLGTRATFTRLKAFYPDRNGQFVTNAIVRLRKLGHLRQHKRPRRFLEITGR